MIFEGKFIQEEGARKAIIGTVVFLVKIFLPMAMIPFQYKKMIVHKKFLKARMN